MFSTLSRPHRPTHSFYSFSSVPSPNPCIYIYHFDSFSRKPTEMCKSLCFWTGQRTGPPSYHESSLSPLQKIKKSGCKSFSIWIRSNTSCHLQCKVTQNEWSTLVQCDEAVHMVKTEVLGNVPPQTFQLLCRVW